METVGFSSLGYHVNPTWSRIFPMDLTCVFCPQSCRLIFDSARPHPLMSETDRIHGNTTVTILRCRHGSILDGLGFLPFALRVDVWPFWWGQRKWSCEESAEFAPRGYSMMLDRLCWENYSLQRVSVSPLRPGWLPCSGAFDRETKSCPLDRWCAGNQTSQACSLGFLNGDT